MLEQADIQLYSEDLEKHRARQNELKEEHDTARTKIADLREQIKFSNEQIEQYEREIRDLENTKRIIADEYNPLNGVIQKIEDTLATDAWERNVKELMDQQASFSTVVERELTKMQNDLREQVGDFVEFIEPTKATELIMNAIERGGISQQLNTVRSGKHNYENAIRDLCEKKLHGQPIDLNIGALPVERLRDWLRHDHVIMYWKKQ